MSDIDFDGEQSSVYRPKFLVSQEDFDAATPEIRRKYNYCVRDEKVFDLPNGCLGAPVVENDYEE